jgi:hypothetical protein
LEVPKRSRRVVKARVVKPGLDQNMRTIAEHDAVWRDQLAELNERHVVECGMSELLDLAEKLRRKWN